jgi:phage shock protein E
MCIFNCLFKRKNTIEISSEAYLIDVRSAEEFHQGSIHGAVNIPLPLLPHCLNDIPKDRQIVVFCRSGSRSLMAKQILKTNGFENVINGGGVEKLKQKLPSSP